jgi:hypothetical protein
MPVSQGSNFSVGIQEEVTYGVAPVSPALVELNVTPTFNISPTKTLLESDAFSVTGQRLFQRHGNKNVAGEIAFDFAPTDFDVILQGVMNNAFSSGVLKHGTGLKSYHLEARYTDVGQYGLYKGLVFNQVSLNIGLDAIIKGSGSVIAKDVVYSTTSFDASLTASAKNAPYTGFEATVAWNGSNLKATAITLTINNNLSSNFTLGANTLDSISKGFIGVEGTFETYFENRTTLDAFLNETEGDLVITVDNGTVSYEFAMLKTKLNSAELSVGGQTAIMVSSSFKSTYDSTEATTLKITKA